MIQIANMPSHDVTAIALQLNLLVIFLTENLMILVLICSETLLEDLVRFLMLDKRCSDV